jgi:diguanylate cyclase (GGDEF)-like protein
VNGIKKWPEMPKKQVAVAGLSLATGKRASCCVQPYFIRGQTVNHEVTLCLAIIEDSGHKAEGHATALRHAGFTVHYELANDLDSLAGLFSSSDPDIVFCGTGKHLPDLGSVTALLTETVPGIPVIAFTDEVTDAAVSEATHNGAIALVAYDNPDSLQDILIRDQHTLLLRRQLRELESRFSETEARCSALMESSRDAIAYIHEGMHIHANNSYVELFGFGGLDEIAGMPVMDMLDPGDHEKFRNYMHTDDSSCSTLEITAIGPGDNRFDAIMEFSPASIDAEACTQVIIRYKADVELEEKLDTLSQHDMLTGLYNRQHFMQVVNTCIQEDIEPGRCQAVAYILLENFRSIREEIGIAGSDIVINDIARLVETACGQDDIIARFGDCVFTVLHNDSSAEGTQQFAETLRQKIGEHASEVEGQVATTTCSIGISIINEHSGNAQNILSRADLACEVARSSGGNQIHVHSTAVDEKMDAGHEDEWDEVISTTIREQRFYLVFQPIVSLTGIAGSRYEVLLRIVDEEGHVILPGQFLAIAEKTGKSGEIDRWVIDKALGTLTELRSNDSSVEFFIKLSGTTLEDRELPVWINQKLKEYRIKSDCICFEVPEAVAVRDLKNTRIFIKAMQNLHCKVAIEHYGCANQPQLIQQLPVDMLKIDGSLIDSLASSEEHQEKIKAIIGLARNSSIQCVAERVEDASDLAKLWEYGVDFIQGNFVQEPSKKLEHDFGEELA